MVFLGISILAGVFTVLAPCILPLLPVVIGASETNSRHISKRALVVIGSLSLSVIVFTLLLKASTLLIDIPQTFWSVFSGIIIILVGIAIAYPSFWVKVPYINKISLISNKAVGTGYQKKSYMGDMLIGLSSWIYGWPRYITSTHRILWSTNCEQDNGTHANGWETETDIWSSHYFSRS